ncbi:MAG: hypothetical protein GX956_07035 [Firmicutes bacterium]|nr:hypothetical protein [Bacillota bacterium]
MNNVLRTEENWDFLIGYPFEEAEDALKEEAVAFVVKFTAPPGKSCDQEEALVIAVRPGQPLEIICASPDWTVN